MDFPLWLWAIPAGSFAALEAAAILNKRQGDTLSELVRRLAGVKPLRPWKPVGVAAIAAFAAWFVHHIVNG